MGCVNIIFPYNNNVSLDPGLNSNYTVVYFDVYSSDQVSLTLKDLVLYAYGIEIGHYCLYRSPGTWDARSSADTLLITANYDFEFVLLDQTIFAKMAHAISWNFTVLK